MFEQEPMRAALGRVNAWLSSHAASYSPLGETELTRFEFRMKAMVEICLYLHLSQAFGADALMPDRLRATVRACVGSRAFLDKLLVNPAQTALYIPSILPFREEEPFRGLAQYYKSVCKPFHNEQMPFQALCHAYTCDALGLYDAGIAALEADAIRTSALHLPPGSLSTPPEGAYPFTHSAFYATRFGTRPLALSEAQRRALEDYSDIELCKAFALKNMDAALEIVMARVYLFGRLTARDAVVIESALSLLDEKGHIRSPKISETAVLGGAESEWEGCYHTMIVAGMLLMSLGFARHPPTAVAAGDGRQLEDCALAMDAVGTMYAAVEHGSLALAVFVLSKLGDLPAEFAPPAREVAPILAWMRGLAGIHKARRAAGDGGLLGMSDGEFATVTALFDQAAARLEDGYRRAAR